MQKHHLRSSFLDPRRYRARAGRGVAPKRLRLLRPSGWGRRPNARLPAAPGPPSLATTRTALPWPKHDADLKAEARP